MKSPSTRQHALKLYRTRTDLSTADICRMCRIARVTLVRWAAQDRLKLRRAGRLRQTVPGTYHHTVCKMAEALTLRETAARVGRTHGEIQRIVNRWRGWKPKSRLNKGEAIRWKGAIYKVIAPGPVSGIVRRLADGLIIENFAWNMDGEEAKICEAHRIHANSF